MYIGHVAVGFAMRGATVRTARDEGPSLGTCVLAAVLADVLVGAFMIAGIEHARVVPGITAVVPFDLYDYPWSHSLVMLAVWAAVMAAVYFVARRRAAAALLLAAGVLSHWVLDAVSHRPDVPIGIHGPYIGLGLWYSKLATVVVEGALFAGAVALYARATTPRDRVGRWALVGLVTFLVATWAPLFFPAPPPSADVLGWTNLASLFLVGWAYWTDAHRRPRP